MNDMLKLCLSLSLSGSILILVLFLCRPLFKSNMSKVWQYYIWLIVIARLLLPFAPEHSLVGNFFRNHDRAVLRSEGSRLPGLHFVPQAGDEAAPNDPPTAPPPPAEEESYFPLRIIQGCFLTLAQNRGIIWLAAALMLLIRKITIYQSFIKYIKAGRSPVDDLRLLEQLGQAAEEAKIHGAVELYINPLISSPLLIGFFHPCIVLPGTDYPDLDLQYTIKHELTHHKRKDMFYKWLMQTTICLHWFNPLVYLMAQDVNRLCELSCDEMIIRHLDKSAMRDYGNTLLGAVKTKGNYQNPLASVTLNESMELLKERLDAIMNFKRPSKMKKILSFLLTLTICFGGVFTGAYAAVPDQLQGNVSGQEASAEEAAQKEAGDVVINLSSNGQNAITKSGSFEVNHNQALTLVIQSDIKGGTVDLFLFSPDNKEQRITLGGSDETKTIDLSAGRWAYNCTGFFESGRITIIGEIK